MVFLFRKLQKGAIMLYRNFFTANAVITNLYGNKVEMLPLSPFGETEKEKRNAHNVLRENIVRLLLANEDNSLFPDMDNKELVDTLYYKVREYDTAAAIAVRFAEKKNPRTPTVFGVEEIWDEVYREVVYRSDGFLSALRPCESEVEAETVFDNGFNQYWPKKDKQEVLSALASGELSDFWQQILDDLFVFSVASKEELYLYQKRGAVAVLEMLQLPYIGAVNIPLELKLFNGKKRKTA